MAPPAFGLSSPPWLPAITPASRVASLVTPLSSLLLLPQAIRKAAAPAPPATRSARRRVNPPGPARRCSRLSIDMTAHLLQAAGAQRPRGAAHRLDPAPRLPLSQCR